MVWRAVAYFGIGFALAGWAIAAIDGVDARINHIKAVGPKVTASVLNARKPGADQSVGHLELQFDTASGDHEDVVVPVDHIGSLVGGDTVTVQYDPIRPSHVIVVGNTANTAEQAGVPFGLTGAGLAIGGLISASRTFANRRATRRHAAERGTKTEPLDDGPDPI